MNIGVFDSGKGGAYIAEGLQRLLPQHSFTVINDHENVPYGSRPHDEITRLTVAAIEPILATCPIIIIACNTATVAAIQSLREQFPHTQFVGTEPMIKPAALNSVSKKITVLATPTTLSSQRYNDLKSLYSQDITIDEPSTRDWAEIIENGDTTMLDMNGVETSISNGSDAIVIACTHYIVLVSQFQQRFPETTVYEPTQAIAQQVERLVSQPQ